MIRVFLASLMTACRQPKIMDKVTGFEGRFNTVLHLSPAQPEPSTSVVVFFGGDVQDLHAAMKAHRDNRVWADGYSLEATTSMLSVRYPSSHIVTVKPMSMFVGTFSAFGNFVKSTAVGVPTFTTDYGAWKHLRELLKTVKKEIDATSTAEPKLLSSAEVPVTLVGFSKGCVVLNQLLFELQEESPNLTVTEFVYLDGGHSGDKDCWLTSESTLKTAIQKLPETTFATHLTPHQISDPMRPWKAKEEKRFTQLMRKLAADRFTRTAHFVEEERSLEHHFKILNAFCGVT